ncbi:MAG: hypothetical protein V9E90_13900 [Saprospiraceae bacterium]|jgi:hypothetical protein
MVSKEFPIASKPGEYLAFLVYLIPTLEGTGYFYYAVDAYSGFAIQLGMDKNDDPVTILKNIYLLTENPDFLQHKNKEFTLILDEYEDLLERIGTIINGVNGRILIDKSYHQYIIAPVLKSLGDFLEKGLNKKVD